MAHLRTLENTSTPGTVVSYPGMVVKDTTGKLAVNVGGNLLYPRYADPVVVAVGDPVTVAITAGPTGAGDAIVTGRITLNPRPATGTVKVVPASSSTITVTGTDGVDYTATFAGSYTPAVNDTVILAWNANTPTALAKVGVVAPPAAPPPPVAAPPAPVSTGQSTYASQDSATWCPQNGSWDSWARAGGRLYQGNYGNDTYGAWFYAGTTSELAGRTITRIQFTLGSRLGVGNYNSPVAVHFYTHSSSYRPGGDVSRSNGPYDVTVQPGAGQQSFDLPTSFASALQNGGGIGIAGDPYAGFNGRLQEAASGLLTIDWTR